MNSETQLSLDDAVEEVLALLTGLDLAYDPQQERYRSVTRSLNRALRAIALEQEWGFYASTEVVGSARSGEQEVFLRSSVRPRIINDDAVRLVDSHGHPVVWAYVLPRDALHKYIGRAGLWCSVTRQTIAFSRPFNVAEDGLEIHVPVMREPRMFRLPDPGEVVPDTVRNQLLDFDYPDLVVAKAAFFYAQTDPVMQPRVQTLEAQYKDMMYQIMERDERNTDSPFVNDFQLPVQAGLSTPTPAHWHPHADGR